MCIKYQVMYVFVFHCNTKQRYQSLYTQCNNDLTFEFSVVVDLFPDLDGNQGHLMIFAEAVMASSMVD